MDNLFVIAGLGNPGKKYDNTRHNVGFDTIDLLSAKFNIKVSKVKYKALWGDGTVGGEKVLLAKPQTFMNLSGESIRELVDWYKVPMSNLILVYDDVDLAVGKIRVRAKGSSGTHNGMRSILYHIQSEDFPRVRIGIGRPPEGWDMADFVLSKFNADDRKLIDESIKKAAEAIEAIIKSGAEAAMNMYNK